MAGTTQQGLVSQATQANPVPEIKPLVDTSSATTPAGTTMQSGPTINTQDKSYTPVAYTGEVDPTKTTQGLITQIMDKSGDLMRYAANKGQAAATARGLGNSSIATQSSMGAMIEAALPIAQQDAQLYQNQNLTNQQAMNALSGVANEFISGDMKMQQEKYLTELKTSMQNAAVNNEFRNRLIGQYQDGVTSILNNPDMTTEQKNASIARLYENLQGTIALSSATSGLNLSQYKPGGTTVGSGAGASGGLVSQATQQGGGTTFDNITGLPVMVAPVSATAPISQQIDYVTSSGKITQQQAMQAVAAGLPLVTADKVITGFTNNGGTPSATYVDQSGKKFVYYKPNTQNASNSYFSRFNSVYADRFIEEGQSSLMAKNYLSNAIGSLNAGQAS